MTANKPVMAKKVLIITYYWPPGGGSGVQRWLKFAKYLREFGWEPIIYTPENPEMPAVDTSLQKDVPKNLTVLKTPIFEPYGLYKRLTGRKEPLGAGFVSESGKVGALERFSRWVRGNFFIPDARRFWIRPSVKYLTKWLEHNRVDAIVSTGPPHSMHFIAMGVKQKTGLPWLADFRDPWTNIDFYDQLHLGKRADCRHHALESLVISTADRVTVVSPTMELEFRDDHGRDIITMTNGFDEDDTSIGRVLPEGERGFGIAHVGTMNPSRNPTGLWKALSGLLTDGGGPEPINIRLVGRVDHSVRTSINEHGLADVTDFIEYVPHDEVVAWQNGASVLLLLLNQSKNARGILPGKFFEYMASGRPILCLGPTDSDAASILRETQSGVCLEYDDVEGIRRWLEERMSATDHPVSDGRAIARFTRRSLTGRLAAILDEMVDKRN